MNARSILFLIVVFSELFPTWAQPNCNLYKRDSLCYEACLEAEKGVDSYVGSIGFQEHLLRAIALCPDFSHAYFELSVPYAKMGMMHEWKKIMDKAVEIDPAKHLGWRGWYHWFFMHNYESALQDIERLEALLDYDIGTTGDGLYHLIVLKGLCYKGLGDTNKAIATIEEAFELPEYYTGSYDLLHLGVLYLEKLNFSRALELFRQQNEYNEVSEAYYYAALAYEKQGEKARAKEFLEVALLKYDAELAVSDPYRQLPDEIYRVDIEDAIRRLK